MITGINHLTLAVSDLERSLRFYRDLLGCPLLVKWPEGAYLTAGNLWIALIVDGDVRRGPLPEYTHVALSVTRENLAILEERIRKSGTTIWQQNTSEGDSLYFLDPDGHKLELHVGGLAERLAWLKSHGQLPNTSV